jgi:hypothetical protein
LLHQECIAHKYQFFLIYISYVHRNFFSLVWTVYWYNTPHLSCYAQDHHPSGNHDPWKESTHIHRPIKTPPIFVNLERPTQQKKIKNRQMVSDWWSLFIYPPKFVNLLERPTQPKINKKEALRIRGIEPRSVPWEGTMIPLH